MCNTRFNSSRSMKKLNLKAQNDANFQKDGQYLDKY